jgi:two-component system, cell cycle sensor histidine kinase and response regulator CckA
MSIAVTRTLLGEVQALIVAVSMAIMILVAVATTMLVSSAMLADLKNKAMATADDLAALLEYPLYNVDHQTAVRIAETYLSSGKICGIELTSTAGGMLLSKSLAAPCARIPSITRSIESSGMTLGSFTITFSDAAVRANQKLFFLVAVIICAAVLIANLVVSRIVGRRVQRPFLEIFRGIETISSGQYATSIPATAYKDVNRLISHFNDMTGKIAAKSEERQRAEAKLAAERQFLVDIIDFLPDATFIVDTARRVVIWNKSAEELTGVSREMIVGKGDYAYAEPFFGERRPILVDLLDQTEIESATAYSSIRRHHRAIYAESFAPNLRQGRGAHLWGVAAPICNQDGDRIGAIEMIRDVSDLKAAEVEKNKLRDQLQQAQKMESVGRLAGGIAHDFNNMLTVILGSVQLTLLDSTIPEALVARLRVIEETTHRSANLVRQLLAFARKQNIAPQAVELNAAVVELLPMLSRLLGEHIVIDWRPAKDLWMTWIDPSQLDQLLINMCANSRDSISGAGTISLETANIVVDFDYCRGNPESLPGNYVLLAVSDDGCGMNKATLEHIYEPFFTTKGVGKGTGMGLATVYGIVKQNGGFINVYSELGKGTTFKIYLPRTGIEAGTESTGAKNETLRASGERVLVVEDDANLLKVAKEMLTNLGYAVVCTQSPSEALDIIRKNFNAIDLLITDVVMPEMNGRELEQRAREFNPSLRSLFVSGYTANVIAHHGIIDAEVCFLQKPFTLQDLARSVRLALGK